MLTVVDLSAAVAQFGPARVFAGNALTAGQLLEIGAVESAIRFSETWNENNLTARRTGGIAHKTLLTLAAVTATFDVIQTTDNLTKVHPLGLQSGGDDRPASPVTATWLLIPESELGDGPNYLSHDGTQWSKDGVTGATSAPKLAIWIWKAYPTAGELPIDSEDGGRAPRTITVRGLYDGTKPRKHRVWTQGDPRAVTPTAIPVLL